MSQEIKFGEVVPSQKITVSTDVTFLDGDDGFSPIVEVEEVEGGHVVTVTDKEGAKSFLVKDGEGVGHEHPQYLTEQALEGYAKTADIPTDEHINGLIETALGVIENGVY